MMFDLLSETAGGFLGAGLGVIAVAVMELINIIFKGVHTFDIVMIVRLVTPLAGALYFARKSWFNVAIPLAAIAIFWIMPESRGAWYFALLWLIKFVFF